MLDESYLDEQTRPPLQPATMAENIESNFPILTGQMHKVYLAKVYSTLAFAFSMACIGAYAVNRNDIHPSLWYEFFNIISKGMQ